LTNIVSSTILYTYNSRPLWRRKLKREPGESISRMTTGIHLLSSSIFLQKADRLQMIGFFYDLWLLIQKC
jgi:hypothetical protein